MKKHAMRSCKITHDGLAAYGNLSGDMGEENDSTNKLKNHKLKNLNSKTISGYSDHNEVNHSETLIDYRDGTNTNGIEGVWGRAKVKNI